MRDETGKKGWLRLARSWVRDRRYDLVTALFAGVMLPITAPAGLLLQAGFDVGGDEMVRAVFVGGESDSINAGELMHFDIGFSVPSATSNPAWESQLTIGWKNDSIDAGNGTMDWSRYPVDFLQFYIVNEWRFGAGLTWHMDPTLEGNGVVAGKVAFENAFGFLLEADYLMGLNRAVFLGARLTLIEYEVDTASISADSLGAVLGLRFQ